MIKTILAGRYKIIKDLGQGSFGKTYLAKDTLLPNKDYCVVKHFQPQKNDPLTLKVGRNLFEKEAQVLNRLGKHNQIPQLLAHFEEEKEFYLVQELIEGNDLSQEIQIGNKLKESEVISILHDVLEILTFVHQQNVIHRDIKPSNIMRHKEDGKLILIDFGAVKEITTQIVNPDGEIDRTFVVGTSGYMPCEQLQGNPQLASDIYAVGMMGIFALTGIPPSQFPQHSETAEIIWRDRASVSNKFANVLNKMVRYHFNQRYPSAKEALEAIKALKSGNKFFKPKVWLSAIALSLAVGIGGYMMLPKTSVYENKDYNLSLQYPTSWKLETKEDFMGTIATFIPEKEISNNVPTQVKVNVENLSRSMNLDKYTTSAVAEILQYLPEAKIIDSRPIMLGEKQAHQVIYTGKDRENNLEMKYMQTWFLEGDRVYIMTYEAEANKYDDYLKTIEATIIKSFEVN